MKQKRIYLVANTDAPNEIRLVRAAHRAQALSHVAHSVFTISVAKSEELVTALLSGVEVENAVDPDNGELFTEQTQTAEA